MADLNETEIMAMRVVDLRAALKERNLDSKGKKAELQKKLKDWLANPSGAADESNETSAPATTEEVMNPFSDDEEQGAPEKDAPAAEPEKTEETTAETAESKDEPAPAPAPAAEEATETTTTTTETTTTTTETVTETVTAADTTAEATAENPTEAMETAVVDGEAQNGTVEEESGATKRSAAEAGVVDENEQGTSKKRKTSLVETVAKDNSGLPPILLPKESAGIKKYLQTLAPTELLDYVTQLCMKFPSILEEIRAKLHKDPKLCKLFIRGLNWDTTSESLTTVFSEYGTVVEARIIMDKNMGRSKGYGFITMSTADEAKKALETPERKIDNRMTYINLASNGPTFGPMSGGRPRGRGGYGGRGRGGWRNQGYGGYNRGGYGGYGGYNRNYGGY